MHQDQTHQDQTHQEMSQETPPEKYVSMFVAAHYIKVSDTDDGTRYVVGVDKKGKEYVIVDPHKECMDPDWVAFKEAGGVIEPYKGK